MKIVVQPHWSFMDALEAARKAYSGGLQYGVPNRTRVLEQWANVVGRERAVSELEAVLNRYATIDKAIDDLGLSKHTIKKLKRSFAEMPEVTPFMSQSDRVSEFSEETFEQFIQINQTAGVDVVAQIIDWITTTADPTNVVNTLKQIEVDDLQKLNAVVGLSNLRNILSIWQDNQKNNNEEFWQKVFTKNSFVFSQLFSFPIVLLEEKAYVGGKSISNKHGGIIDYLCVNNLTKNVALIEIKNPLTKLLGSEYRTNVYSISSELSGSVVQIENYKNSLLKKHTNTTLSSTDELSFEAFNPKCIVIIGNLGDEITNKAQKKSFELFRTGLKDVQIITYDELFERIKSLVNLLEGQRG